MQKLFTLQLNYFIKINYAVAVIAKKRKKLQKLKKQIQKCKMNQVHLYIYI